MGESNPREGPWIGTRKGKITVTSGIIATVVVAFVIVPLGIVAYLDSIKLRAQRGDTVDFVYTGMYDSNGTVFDSGALSNQVIGSNGLLDYFDQQLVGMEPGVETTFVIPHEFGYTDPGYFLYGHDMRFEVTITKLTRGGTVLFPVPAP